MNQFSIILPVRNGGRYVKECVNAILSQSYPHFNLLVLDNNSTDGTAEWIKSINDPRIVVYTSEQPLTIEANWARAVGLVKNEYMTLIGHDDIFLPHYLETMDSLINRHPGASLYQTHFDFIDQNGKMVRHCQQMDEKQEVAGFLQSQFHRSIDSTGTGYMMRSDDYDRLGGIPGYPNLIFADFELWVRLTAISYKATDPQTCFYYRLHESVSKVTGAQAFCDAFERYILFLASFGNEKATSVIQNDGIDFLYFFCESLSHRLLKTPRAQRGYSVAGWIKKCRHYVRLLQLRRPFRPVLRLKILAAAVIDSNTIFRQSFLFLKRRIGSN